MTGGTPARDAIRVLIVDDNRDFADNLAELARLYRLEPHVAGDCRGALRLAAAQRFDVAVVDEKLPDGRGTELLARLRQIQPDLVALVVTAFVSLDNALAALHEGAFAFIGKDADAEDLVRTLARAAENAVLRRENRGLRGLQQAILDALPDLLLVVDAQGRLESANHSHPRFCPDPERALGRRLDEVTAPEVRQRLALEPWLAEVAAGRASGERTVDLTGGDASIHGLRAVPLPSDPRGRMLLRVSDLTERITLERRLTEAENLATLGRLVSSIAHEIRNPLAGIRALAQLLERTNPAPRERENLGEILALTDRMHATLSDLLDYARPGARRAERLELVSLIGSFVLEARRWPSAEGRTLALAIDDPRPFEIEAARDRLLGLCSNLIDNALQAAPAGGRVSVSWRRIAGSGAGELSVEDDGPGLAPEALSHLFEPFFTTRTRGTGLGLSIVKKTVDALGGTIEAGRSETLGGARMTVRFQPPLASDSCGT